MTIKKNTTSKSKGLFAAFLSPTFLGVMPIIAKFAYSYQVDVYTVAALRTIIAAAMLWIVAIWLDKDYIFSSKPAIIGSFIAGAINGLGSLLFYTSLTRIDASMGQLINITYLIYVTLLLRLAGQHISKLTLFRTGMAILAIYIITSSGLGEPDWVGVGYMAIAALSYAVQIVFSQRIMYDIPAITMTLYALTGMSFVVTIAWLVATPSIAEIPFLGWGAVITMGIVTALARLTLFLGVKNIGGMQTSLIGVAEVVISIVLAYWLLGEVMTTWQLVGAFILITSILLVKYEKDIPSANWGRSLIWNLIWVSQRLTGLKTKAKTKSPAPKQPAKKSSYVRNQP